MAKKRKTLDSAAEPFYNKRSRLPDAGNVSPNDTASVQPRIDPTYGQRGAFPGLDDVDGEDDLFYRPASDGLEYLRMVRSEAKTVPNLLVAPISPIAEHAKLPADCSQGYYADGAYTAAPTQPLSSTKANEVEDADPQDAYYIALRARFFALSTTLNSPSTTTVTTAHNLYSATHGTWRYQLLYSQPTMVLLGQLQQDTVIRGLNVVETLLTKRNLTKGKILGAWVWGLLARCRPVGEMGSEEVGVLRSLGKRAVWLLGEMIARREDGRAEEEVDDQIEVKIESDGIAGFGEPQSNGTSEPIQEEQMNDGVMEHRIYEKDNSELLDPNKTSLVISATQALTPSNTDPPKLPPGQSDPAPDTSDALAQARQRLLSTLPQSSSPSSASNIPTGGTNDLLREHNDDDTQQAVPEVNAAMEGGNERYGGTNIFATLDMITTIVGEFYGQRDLLDGRFLWDEI